MNVKQIITEYLKAKGFDGLCNKICGCGIDDLMPCGDCDISDCRPAYKTTCVEECDKRDECDGMVGYDCYRTITKESANAK